MSARTRRLLAVASVLCVLALGVALAGPAVGTGTDTIANTDRAGIIDDRDLEDRSAPFAQADGETHVINITNPDENVEYTLTAPGLDPVAPYVEVGENAEDAENPEVIRGTTVFGTIGNGAYDTYRFAGPIENVQLDSENIEALEVRIDGESVDPRTLDGEETETATETPTPTATATTTPTATETATARTTTTETATETPTATETETITRTTETATETETATATASETAASTNASTASPSPTPSATATDSTPTTATPSGGSGGESSGGEFTLLMYILIGVVSGLVLAASLAYVVRS